MTRFQIVLLTAIFTLFAGCKKTPITTQAAPPTVVVAAAQAGKAAEAINVIGQVQADKSVTLIARVSGFIIKRNFKEGDVVKAGQVLYEIEPEQYQANLSSAEASLLRAQANLQNKTVERERQEMMYKQNAASKRDLDNAAAAELEAQAGVKSAEAALQVAKLNLSYTNIKAPFDGIAGLTKYEVGDMVGPESGELTTVITMTPVRVKFKLSELLLLALTDARLEEKTQDRPIVRLFLDNGKEYDHTGTIEYWDNNISSTTGTIQIQALFDNPKNLLLPGMNVRVSLENSNPPPAVLIPQLAVQEDQQGKFVYLVNAEHKVIRQSVNVSGSNGNDAVVLSGVKVGENVIVDGVQKVRNGITVNEITQAQRDAQQAETLKKLDQINQVKPTENTPAGETK